MTPGHNNPPPHVTMAMHVEELFTLVSGSVESPVTSDEQEAALDELLDQVRQARKDADTMRADEKRPHDNAAKLVQETWKPIIARCDAGEDAIKAALTPYRTAKQRAKDEAARIAREEAEASQRAAQAKLRDAADLEERFAAEAALAQAGKVVKVAAKVDRTATGLRTYWTAEVTDRRAALNHYIKGRPEAFADLIQQLADQDARGARPSIPGVIYHQNQRAA